MRTIQLTENAVAVLRLRARGHRLPVSEHNLTVFHELVAAGIMEAEGKDFRLTETGRAEWKEIVDKESERIERERYEPPDVSGLSEPARTMLRKIVAERRVEITPDNRPHFRELAAARIVILLHGTTKGDESAYRFTYHGWHQRFELVETACAKQTA